MKLMKKSIFKPSGFYKPAPTQKKRTGRLQTCAFGKPTPSQGLELIPEELVRHFVMELNLRALDL